MHKFINVLKRIFGCTLAIIVAILIGLAAPLLMPVFLIVGWWATKALIKPKQIQSN